MPYGTLHIAKPLAFIKVNSSKNIGRFVLLQHFLLIVGVALVIPIVIELLDSGRLNVRRAISGFYKLQSFNENDTIFLLCQLSLILIGIWFFGGKAGRLITSNKRYKFRTGFLALFKLWGIFIIIR